MELLHSHKPPDEGDLPILLGLTELSIAGEVYL